MIRSRARVLSVLRTSALVTVPLLCGALFFLLQAQGRSSGVYVEVYGRPDNITHELAGFTARTPEAASAAAAHAVVPPSLVLSFFVVGPPASPLMAAAPQARLYAFVVDTADPSLVPEYVPIGATVHRVNARAYRVISDQLSWKPGRVAYEHYQEVVAKSPRPRATLEALIGLELAGSAGGRTMFAVRIGPAQ